MYVQAGHWTFKPGSARAVVDAVKEELVPALAKWPGYVRSMFVQTGDDSFLAVVWWDAESSAKEALAPTARLVIDHIGPLLREVERFPGPVVLEHGVDGGGLTETPAGG